jgi:hypothetical protein
MSIKTIFTLSMYWMYEFQDKIFLFVYLTSALMHYLAFFLFNSFGFINIYFFFYIYPITNIFKNKLHSSSLRDI